MVIIIHIEMIRCEHKVMMLLLITLKCWWCQKKWWNYSWINLDEIWRLPIFICSISLLMFLSLYYKSLEISNSNLKIIIWVNSTCFGSLLVEVELEFEEKSTQKTCTYIPVHTFRSLQTSELVFSICFEVIANIWYNLLTV